MKGFITILLITLTSVLGLSQTNKETQMVNKINEIRETPKSFIPVIESYIARNTRLINMIESGKLKVSSSNGGVNTQVIKSNIDAAKELISVLDTTSPLPKLEFNVEMYKITKKHSDYIDSINKMTHIGKDGGTVNDRMSDLDLTIVSENLTINNGDIQSALVNLLVDSRIKDRGHRKNLLDRKIKFISVSTSGSFWVQNFGK
jgi:uncharacterized protein YkwD